MPRKTTNTRAQHRSRLLRANVWSIRTLWHSTLKSAYRLILLLLVLGTIAAAGWGGKVGLDRLLYNNPDFRLQAIELNPNEAINERDFVAITGLDLDANLFRINVKEITKRLLGQPSITTARIERQTPGTLIVNVTARKPRAWLACPEDGLPATRKIGALLISSEDVVYPCPALQFKLAASLPIIELSHHDDFPIAVGDKLSHPELTNCVRLINTIREQDGGNLDWIDSIKQAKVWSLTLTTREGTVATFGLRDHARQLANLHTAIEHVRRKGEVIDTINLIPRENVPYTVKTAVPPKAIPVAEPAATPIRGTQHARDLQSILNRN